jgi:hypothetical protein
MGVAFHFSGPLQKTPEISAFPPGKFPKLQQADLVHFYAGVGLDPPQQIRAAPRGEVMSAGGIPQEADNVAHEDMIQNSFATEVAEKTLRRLPQRAQRKALTTKDTKEHEGNQW